MRVLRRRLDNLVQFTTFGGVGLLIALSARSPVRFVVGALLLALAVRTLRAGVYLDPAGVTVRNVFWTHRVPWADYQRVDISRAGRPSLPAVVMRRESGPPVALWCIQTTVRGKRGLERLTALHQEVQRAVAAVRPS